MGRRRCAEGNAVGAVKVSEVTTSLQAHQKLVQERDQAIALLIRFGHSEAAREILGSKPQESDGRDRLVFRLRERVDSNRRTVEAALALRNLSDYTTASARADAYELALYDLEELLPAKES